MAKAKLQDMKVAEEKAPSVKVSAADTPDLLH